MSTVPPSRTKEAIDHQRVPGVAGIRIPTLPPGRGDSNDLGHNFTSTNGGENPNNSEREPQRRSLGPVTPETSHGRRLCPAQPSMSATRSQGESAATAVERLRRGVETERRGILLGQTNAKDRVVCGDSGVPDRALGVSVPARAGEGWGEGKRVGIEQAQQRCGQMSRGGADDSQETRRTHADNDNVQWVSQDDGVRHQGGLWMTQEEEPVGDGDTSATHAGGGNKHRATQLVYSTATAPAPPPESTRRTAQSPREGRWIQQSENHRGVSNPWVTHAGVGNGSCMTQPDRSTSRAAAPESRARTVHRPATRRRDRGTTVDGESCRQDEAPPEGDLRRRQDGRERRGGQVHGRLERPPVRFFLVILFFLLIRIPLCVGVHLLLWRRI